MLNKYASSHLHRYFFKNVYVFNSTNIKNIKVNTNSFSIKQPFQIILHSEKYTTEPSKKINFSLAKTNPSKYINYNIIQKTKPTYPLKTFFNNIFLPRDYPNSVKKGYLQYTKYSFLINTISNLMDFLSTQILINSLKQSNQPNSNSLKLSAGLNWVIKDGIGEFSSIFLSSKFNHSFEQNLKQWRVFTLFLYNISLFGEIVCMKIKSPLKLLLFASISKIIKLFASSGNLSARIGILDNLCNDKNISDLQNKSSSQSNLSFTLGTLIGMGISFLVPLTPLNIIKIISLLSGFFMYYAYKSLNKITIPALNNSRMYILYNEYLKHGKFILMEDVNKKEKPFFQFIKNFNFAYYSLDYAINKINSCNGIDYSGDMIKLFKERKQRFICLVKLGKNNNSFEMFTNLHLHAKTEDFVIAYLYSIKTYEELIVLKKKGMLNKENLMNVMKKNLEHEFILKQNEIIKELIMKNFDLKTNLLETHYERFQFYDINNTNKRKLL